MPLIIQSLQYRQPQSFVPISVKSEESVMNLAIAPLFSSRFEELVFWAVFIFGFVVPFAFFARWSLKNSASTKARPYRDVSTLTNFAIIPAAGFAIWLGYTRVGPPLPDMLLYPGLTMFLLGLALTVWAYRTLGRFFSLEVQVQAEHRIVNTGPYRLLRHPGYAGVLLAFIGLGLALQSWVSVLLLLIVMTAAFAYRIRTEEKFMVTELGDQYIQYMATTKRLVPYVW
jgi:protein-S-isoprenylcysteine O-methyltransferase Ste14